MCCILRYWGLECVHTPLLLIVSVSSVIAGEVFSSSPILLSNKWNLFCFVITSHGWSEDHHYIDHLSMCKYGETPDIQWTLPDSFGLLPVSQYSDVSALQPFWVFSGVSCFSILYFLKINLSFLFHFKFLAFR